MKSKFFSLSLILFLALGCAGPKVNSSHPQGQNKARPQSIWYLMTSGPLILHFTNIDSGIKKKVTLDQGLNLSELPVGRWSLDQILKGKKRYKSLSTHSRYIFRSLNKVHSYGGSIFLGCPKVSKDKFKFLQSMAFFNRYPFKSLQESCELIVGDDFKSVKSELSKLPDFKDIKVQLGF